MKFWISRAATTIRSAARLRVSPPLACRRRPPLDLLLQQFPHLQKFIEMRGLPQVHRRPQTHTRLAVARGIGRAEDNDRHIPPALAFPNPLQHVAAVDPRQIEIQNHQRGVPDLPRIDLRDKLNRLLSVGLHHHREPHVFLGKSEFNEGHVAQIVFRNQNVRIARRRGITNLEA